MPTGIEDRRELHEVMGKALAAAIERARKGHASRAATEGVQVLSVIAVQLSRIAVALEEFNEREEESAGGK